MVKYIVFAFVAVLALQAVSAKPKAATKTEKSQLEELSANAQQIVQNVTAALQGDLPDSKKIVDVLNTNAQTLANHVQDVVNKIKAETKNHQGDIDNVVKQVETKLAETAKKLKEAAGPEAQAKAKEIKENLDKSLKEVTAQAEKLVKSIEPDANKMKKDLVDATKLLLDNIVSVSNNLKEQVKNAEKS